MRKTLTISLAVAALAASGTALAQAPERGAMRGMELTRDAAQQRATQLFERLDLNSDGQLNAEDREAREHARFERLDADGSGAIEFSEFTAQREQRREMVQERRAARAERAPQADERPERLARREGREGREGRRGAGMRSRMAGLRAIGTQADTDSNGSISQAEFMTAALARFDAADANGDGTITRDERRGAHMQGRRLRGSRAG